MHKTLEYIILNIRESFAMAVNALRTNKLRSFLTLLGIAVGVFSIIAVMTAMGVLINGIESGLSQLGAHTFQVQKYPAIQVGGPRERAKFRNRKNITYEQGLYVKKHATLAQAVALENYVYGKTVKSIIGLKSNPNITIMGEDIEGFRTNNWNIEEGRLFTQDELNAKRNLAVLGAALADKIFPKMDPIGKSIFFDGFEFEVVGVLQLKGQMLGGNQDNFVAIPITTFLKLYGSNRSITIMVQSLTPEVFEDCIEQVRGILRTVRKVEPGEEDDFYIFSNDSLIQQFNDFTRYVRLGIMLISTIALIAAGVGIMNIMLVSVTERTREIGIRKAVGAKKSNIITQFILEAVLLSEFGGVIGIALGIIGGNVAALFLEVPPVIPIEWAIIGFVSCSIIGVSFGVYPAWKAANLDPIESLRYE